MPSFLSEGVDCNSWSWYGRHPPQGITSVRLGPANLTAPGEGGLAPGAGSVRTQAWPCPDLIIWHHRNLDETATELTSEKKRGFCEDGVLTTLVEAPS
jgi:hypothetical protein